jgi:hypothetical protein
MDLSNKIRYISHFDELTWRPHLLERPFNEIKVPYMGRPSFVTWINTNVESYVYIWSGVITPEPNESNWGRLIAPDKETTFLIFNNEGDQTRYTLEFVGSDNTIHVKIHKNGLDAYHSRRK